MLLAEQLLESVGRLFEEHLGGSVASRSPVKPAEDVPRHQRLVVVLAERTALDVDHIQQQPLCLVAGGRPLHQHGRQLGHRVQRVRVRLTEQFTLDGEHFTDEVQRPAVIALGKQGRGEVDRPVERPWVFCAEQSCRRRTHPLQEHQCVGQATLRLVDVGQLDHRLERGRMLVAEHA